MTAFVQAVVFGSNSFIEHEVKPTVILGIARLSASNLK